MIIGCGYYDLDTEPKTRFGHRYFVARHRFNPTKVELVFYRDGTWQGKKNWSGVLKKRS